MKTLIINCYLNKPEEKIQNYVNLIEGYGTFSIVRDKDIKLGDVDYDAVIISGSERFVSRGELNPKLFRYMNDVDIPLLTICYSHQILGILHGCEVTHKNRVKGPVEIEIIDNSEIFDGFGKKAVFDENHAEYVVYNRDLFDAELKLLARSNSSIVEAMRTRGRPHYGVQFHPERSGKNGKELIRNFYRYVVKK